VNANLKLSTGSRFRRAAVAVGAKRIALFAATLATLAAVVAACSDGPSSNYPGGIYPPATTKPTAVPADGASDADTPAPNDTGVIPPVLPSDTGAADVKGG
jgi:hypothetical protein